VTQILALHLEIKFDFKPKENGTWCYFLLKNKTQKVTFRRRLNCKRLCTSVHSLVQNSMGPKVHDLRYIQLVVTYTS